MQVVRTQLKLFETDENRIKNSFEIYIFSDIRAKFDNVLYFMKHYTLLVEYIA